MTVYVFGNQLVDQDNIPLKILPQLKKEFPQLKFFEIDPTEEFIPEENSVIIDTVLGIDQVTLFTSFDNFSLSPKVSLHDYDLGFHLRFLKKLGRLKVVKIIGVPISKNKKIITELVANEIKKLINQQD